MPRTAARRALARELDLTEMRIRQLERRGMPVHDVDAARAWRAANVRYAAVRDTSRRASAKLST